MIKYHPLFLYIINMKKLYILKGFHYSTFLPRFFKLNNKLSKTIKATFNKSSIYNIDEKSCVNKLWGFTNGLFGVHKNSYRFGWTYDESNEEINIWIYTYINGRLHKKLLTTVDFDNEYTYTITLEKLNEEVCKVTYNFDNKIIEEIEIPTTLNKYSLELGFYFGGSTRAPHNMCLEFNRV